MNMNLLLAISLLSASSAACGTDTAGGDDDPASPDATTIDPGGYQALIRGGWSLPPSSEKYLCVRQTATTDLYIKSLRPIAPTGTHHTVLMLGPPDAADGVVDCSSALVKPAIYASGVGTLPLDLPSGVAVHVRPGQQLLLNLHLFNASDATLTGDSGIEIIAAPAAEVVHEAGVVLAGKAIGLQVVPGASTQTGRCTTPAGATLFAVAPHMHTLATRMKITYENAGGGNLRTLHDQPYSFDEQRFQMVAPALVTTAGGRLTVECAYFNPTGTTVTFGESTEQEMCYALAFVYPPPPVTQCVQ